VTLHKVQKLKFVAPAVAVKRPYELVDLPYVGLEHIQSWTGKISLDAGSNPEGTVSLFEIDDILFGKLRPYLAKVTLAEFQGACSTEALVLRPRPGNWPPYLRYVLSQKQLIEEVDASTYGAKMPRASWDFIGSRVIATPDLPTQKIIANFLDCETARIDQLIENKERQRILISERRDAVAMAIFEAQLSSCQIAPLRRFVSSMCDGPFGSSLKSEHYVDHGVRVVRLQNIGLRRFLDEDVAFIDPMHYATLGDHDVLPGDLLVASLGDPKNPVGRACIASPGLGPAMVKADCFRVRLDRRQLRHDFVACFLSSPAGIEQTARHAKGVTRDRINLSILASLKVPVPTLAEQQGIVSTFSDIDAKVMAIDGKVGASIHRLRERRSALITAAVTGAIDVAAWGKRDTFDRRIDVIEAEWPPPHHLNA
jgi:type I restriction enzyme S subunit